MAIGNPTPYNPDLPLRLPEFTLLSRAALHMATLQENLATQRVIEAKHAFPTSSATPVQTSTLASVLESMQEQISLRKARLEKQQRISAIPRIEAPEATMAKIRLAITESDDSKWTDAMSALADFALCDKNPLSLSCAYLVAIDKHVPIARIPSAALRILVDTLENEAMLSPNPEQWNLPGPSDTFPEHAERIRCWEQAQSAARTPALKKKM